MSWGVWGQEGAVSCPPQKAEPGRGGGGGTRDQRRAGKLVALAEGPVAPPVERVAGGRGGGGQQHMLVAYKARRCRSQ